MSARLGFALSLLAACGFHAILLFAPRAAIVVDMHSPTVELELTDIASAPSAAVRAEGHQAAAPRTAAAPAPAAPPSLPQPAILPQVETAPTAQAPASDGQAEAAVASEPASSGAPSVASDAGTGEGAGSATAGDVGSPSSTGNASGSTPGGAGSVIVPAMVPSRPLAEVRPKYPLSARRAGFEGVVKVVVYVDEKGEVTAVRVIASSGHSSLDQAVLDAYRAARYAPAFQHGKPVASTDVWSYRFKLTE